MGFAKRQWMQQQEQGWEFSDYLVCTNCLDDYALEDAVSRAATEDAVCSFCESAPAAPLDALLEVFVNGIHNEYGDPDNEGVYYETREGGYQWETIDTWDLVDQFSDVFNNDCLIEKVQNLIEHKLWVEKDFIWRRRDEVLTESWEQFCHAVMYETRYVFWLKEHDMEPEGTGEIHPARILQEIGKLIVELNLTRELPKGSRFWRCRATSSGEPLTTAATLGTVPALHSLRANRMNPAGIPMFYGSTNADTAFTEVFTVEPGSNATGAQFETSRAATVVDFVDLLPAVPSIFDPELGHMRRQLVFLHKFVDRLSEPVRPTYEQIDYVPTQIVTEYLLRIFSQGEVKGIMFRSPLTGGTNVVLDVPNDRCIEADIEASTQLSLRLVKDSIFSRSN